jgi:hypothetical protein
LITGVSRPSRSDGGLALLLGLGLAADVDLERAPQDERAGGLVERLHLHQHPADVGMDDDRVSLGVGIALVGDEGPALAAVLGVGDGVLVGDLALGEALQADSEPGRVHHDEHRRRPFSGSPTSQPVALS